MRSSNIQVSFKIPVPINKPDGNGVVYTKEVVEKAVLESKLGLPIEIINGMESIVVGVTDKLKLIYNDEYYIEVSGVIWHGGTKETVDVKDNMIDSIQIVGIGIPDK